MNPAPGEPWRRPGASQTSGNLESGGQPQGGAFGSFGPPAPQQQQHTSVLPPPPPPPPPPSYHQHHSQPSANHNLSIADLTQGPPQAQHQYNTQPPPSQSHPIPALAQHPLPHQSPPYINRERELRDIREREMREQEMREQRSREMQQRHQEDLMLRERDARDRDQILQREQQLQGRSGSMPIHQPVASKVQNPIHGPNGLLANGGAIPPQQTPTSFGMHNQVSEPPRQPTYSHQAPVHPQGQPGQPIFTGPSQAQAQLPHGQQPILNDALSYLDQVKVRFSDHPDVYNRFLDIMKDFKSQAIDTPGVIERVSNLFNGHPTLIQGFNTFLPPGYRIECGTEENPDAIRVTTPSGTMTQSLHAGARGRYDGPPVTTGPQAAPGRPDTFEGRHGWAQPVGQHTSPGARSVTVTGYEPTGGEREQDSTIHQQEQRGVSSLQNAVSNATNGTSRPVMAVSPAPPTTFGQSSGLFSQPGDPKRGPVEFNHAISYNRFAQQPEIYKQFLEILQTYQRESKPIHDVYSQVTQLFSSAPDLLEDFKQFLPETAAHAKAQASARAAAAEEMMIPTSNIRGAPGYANDQIAQAHTPRPAAKMPPMGQFDPPSTSKENKKRRGPGITAAQPIPQPALDPGLSTSRAPAVQVGNAAKRQKLSTQQRQVAPDGPVPSPTLIPQLPEPLPPLPPLHTTQEEFGFFDRAKKHIGNRASYAEFLKLINLFTQDLIDKHVLIDRVGAFIGNNPDLMAFFTNFLGIEEQEDLVESRIRPDPGRVNLSHCRSLGPSYRHLPKRDQNKLCKGRDAMCYEVLNDVWASHPTWASEDSGFVAHRKNQYEEALHRVEEERHDYDFHIESCQRTIQLMEPLVQQINAASDADRANFQLQPGLGGASEAIPKRIIMKIYGREVGARIMSDMFVRPAAVLPIILRRLKQKLEEWKQVQREWEKIWREQIHRQFWKSLDHQGINAKNLDKKNFQQKTLVSEIQAKFEEQRKSRDAGFPQPKHQLEYSFTSPDVVLDATRLVLVGLEADRSNYNPGDQTKIRNFFLDFIPKFFSMDKQLFENLVLEHPDLVRSQEEADEEPPSEVRPVPRSKSKLKKQALLYRNVLDRSRDESVVSGSKESTPMPIDASDTEMPTETILDGPTLDNPPTTWIKLNPRLKESTKLFTLDEAYPHTTFNFWANANLYQFFRLYEMLYSRLLALKQNEKAVHESVHRYKGEGGGPKPAVELGMIDKGPDDFFNNTGPDADYYTQVLLMCEEVIAGILEMSHLEETLRRYYNATGWQLYTVDKLVAAIIRCIWGVLSSDNKDKSLDITNLFLKDRDRPDTTRAQEIQYRKQVEKFSKDGEVYRISFTPQDGSCTVRFFPPEDSTFDSDALSEEARWNYYLSSYAMTYATEGVDQSAMQYPFLRRSIPVQHPNVEAAYEEIYAQLYHRDDQTASISPDTYKIRIDGEWVFYRFVSPRKKYTPGKIEENERFVEKFVRNVAWMKDQRAEDVERRKAAWEKGVKDGMDGFESKAQDTSRSLPVAS